MENSTSENSQSVLPRKKIFQIVLKNFATIGIEPKLIAQPNPLNVRILMGFGFLGLSIICIFKYFFYEAKTFIEYTQTAYMGSAAVLLISALLILILNVESLFKLINDCENLVNLSKCTNLFDVLIFDQFY